MEIFRPATSFLLAVVIAGCAPQPESKKDPSTTAPAAVSALRLPPGDADQGREDFIEHDCHWCHRVQGVPLPDKDAPEGLMLPLDRHQLTQPQLLTAITNPEHIFSARYRAILDSPGADAAGAEPLMPSFTGTMSVRQLIDIVAFLEQIPKES